MTPLPRILFVDDDPNILSAYKRNLRHRFSIDTAPNGDAGLDLVNEKRPYAVVVADMQMPGMNGIEFLKRVVEKTPDTVRLMLTGNADQKTASDAVNHGHVFSFLSKPCPSQSLEVALDNALRQYNLIRAEKELLEETLNGAVKVLTDILAVVDPQAFSHAQRLRVEIRAVAEGFGIKRAWELELAAMLSQIGTVAIPPETLSRSRNQRGLSASESEIIDRIPEVGACLLTSIPRMETVANIVRYQRKNFDGTGFPNDSIAGPLIPIGARILRVLSDLLALEWNQRTRADAFNLLKETVGIYDPKVLQAVASCFDVYVGIENAEHRKVPLAELKIGDVLVGDVFTKEGMLIVASGAEISAPLLSKLQNFKEIIGIREPLFVA